MKQLNQLLNIVIGTSIGVLIGHGLWRCFDYCAHPDLYAANSAPWYASILLYIAVTVVVVVVASIVKAVIRKRMK